MPLLPRTGRIAFPKRESCIKRESPRAGGGLIQGTLEPCSATLQTKAFVGTKRQDRVAADGSSLLCLPASFPRSAICAPAAQLRRRQRNPRAAASWLFFRVARSLRIDLDTLVVRALKNSQLTCGDVTIICETVHWTRARKCPSRRSDQLKLCSHHVRHIAIQTSGLRLESVGANVFSGISLNFDGCKADPRPKNCRKLVIRGRHFSGSIRLGLPVSTMLS